MCRLFELLALIYWFESSSLLAVSLPSHKKAALLESDAHNTTGYYGRNGLI